MKGFAAFATTYHVYVEAVSTALSGTLCEQTAHHTCCEPVISLLVLQTFSLAQQTVSPDLQTVSLALQTVSLALHGVRPNTAPVLSSCSVLLLF